MENSVSKLKLFVYIEVKNTNTIEFGFDSLLDVRGERRTEELMKGGPR